MRRRQVVAILAVAVIIRFSPAVMADDAVDLVRRAEKSLQRNDCGAAIEPLVQAASARPDWYIPPARLAVAYHMAGMDGAALQQYIRVQQIVFETFSPSPGLSEPVRSLVSEAEGYMTMLVNQTRSEQGLRMLYPHPMMTTVARGHAAEMRDRNYFSHISPNKSNATIVERFENEFSFRARVLAENLSRRWTRGNGYTLKLAKVRQSHEDLLNSPGHYANIVLPELTHIGIGIEVNDNGDYWIVQVFADMTGHREY
ncbi:MAG TPA: hypothetical protein DGT21_22040 [Armatimonadetes bacterium]|jgi:uncharacterized protein YkwD|nr:hypothetical protein [Armatimonadota bacterium]